VPIVEPFQCLDKLWIVFPLDKVVSDEIAFHRHLPLLPFLPFGLLAAFVNAEAATDLIFGGVLGFDKSFEAILATRGEVVSLLPLLATIFFS
jgi:hypothetical protein